MEVDDHTLHGIHQCIVAEMMVGLLQPSFHSLEIQTAYLLLHRGQLHDGILKQKELAAHAVVALGRAEFYELLRHIDDIHAEFLAFLQVHHQVPPTGNNHAVASLEAELLSVALKSTIPIVTIGMTKIVGEQRLTDSFQCIVYNYMLYGLHNNNVLSLSVFRV